jgi:molybdenum transport protein
MARLEAMLREDVPYGDLTTLGLGIAEAAGRATLSAAAPMTLCCAEEAVTLFQLAGAREVRRLAKSGALLEPGSPILTAEGPAAALHAASKTAQTLMEIASGIATRASRIRAAAQLGRPGVAVAGTRKHLPGAKDLSLRALTAGGCVPHRLGLSDSILVFAHHRAFLGREPPHLWVSRLRAAQPERKIAVGAESVDQAVQMAHAGVDAVQCDRMTPDQLAEVIRALSSHPNRPTVAVTGDIHEGNAADFARAGADLLVTSAAYAAAPLDVAVAMEKL